MQIELDETVRVGEVAEALGVTRQAVQYLIAKGELEAVKAPWGWLIDRSEVERLRLERAARGLPRRKKA